MIHKCFQNIVQWSVTSIYTQLNLNSRENPIRCKINVREHSGMSECERLAGRETKNEKELEVVKSL